jgi:hypothetical protein
MPRNVFGPKGDKIIAKLWMGWAFRSDEEINTY